MRRAEMEATVETAATATTVAGGLHSHGCRRSCRTGMMCSRRHISTVSGGGEADGGGVERNGERGAGKTSF